MRDEPNGTLKGRTARSCRPHKRCCKIQTAGRWPWKSEPAKECVTTHLPNLAALKKDGAEAGASYVPTRAREQGRVSRKAWGPTVEALAVRRSGGAPSADLGGSSDHTSATLVD